MDYYFEDEYAEGNEYEDNYDRGSPLGTAEEFSLEEVLKSCVGPTTLQIGVLLGWNVL